MTSGSGRVFAFFIVDINTKQVVHVEVVHVGVTRHPTAQWTTQQLREATPFGAAPQFIIRDNDGKFGADFDRAAKGAAMRVLRDVPTLLAHRSLWGCESRPYPEAEVASLTAPELALLNDLRSNRWGQGVRLEQERIPWSHAVDALLRACNDAEPPIVP